MLSDDLRSFAGWLDAWAEDGVTLDPLAVNVLRAQVSAYAVAAEHLEHQAVPLWSQRPNEVARLDLAMMARRQGGPR